MHLRVEEVKQNYSGSFVIVMCILFHLFYLYP